MKKILFVNVGDSITNRTTWSGIPFSIFRELQKYYDVDTFTIKSNNNNFFSFFRIFHSKYISKTKYLAFHTTSFSKKASRILSKYLKNKVYDVILVIGVAQLAFLITSTPVIYFTDAVVSAMDGYYWKLSKRMANEANYVQKLALEKASLIIVTSNWAKQSIIRDYHISEDKISIVHFGANIETDSFEHLKHISTNLLFVGIGWDRKGGDVAIDMMQTLKRLDPETQYNLFIVGSEPPYPIADDNIVSFGLLNRDIDSQREKLEYLRKISDIFVLPTHAECAGIVFSEACAYSMPSITYDSGGIPDYVINGYNGYRLAVNSTGKDFAQKIVDIKVNGNLKMLQQNARYKYTEDLNWKHFGQRLCEEIDKLKTY